MPTKHPRVNITFEAAYAGILSDLADKESRSLASMAKELILEALDRREDMGLSKLAEARDTVQAKRVKHTDAWK